MNLQLLFRKNYEIKQFNFFVMQRDYNFIMSPVLSLFLSHKSSKKSEKEGGTNFALLCRPTNLIGWFMKTYFHNTIKILLFISHEEIQKCFDITLKLLV